MEETPTPGRTPCPHDPHAPHSQLAPVALDSVVLPGGDIIRCRFLPLGFAGGLVDRHTGLVRFGFRDYDPRAGRFTAPDPLGDTGGDHDPYDYCVDDPVSAFDPLGLEGAGIARNVAPFWAPYGSKEKQRVQEILGDKGQELRKGMKSIQALDEATSPTSWGFAVPDLVDAVLQETKRIWREIDHPRDKNTGKFIDK